MSSERILLTVSETAEVLGLSRSTVYSQLLHRPDFPTVRIGGSVRVNRQQLQLWADTHTEGRALHECI